MNNAAATFTDDTLRALGLNAAGVRTAWFVVRVHLPRNRYAAQRAATAAEADALVKAARAVGRNAMIEVWFTGDTAPVREWAPMPLTSDERRAARP